MFSGERMPLACRFRRLAENLVPHSSSWEARKFVERESGGPPDSARGPRALPGVPGGTLNSYPRPQRTLRNAVRWHFDRLTPGPRAANGTVRAQHQRLPDAPGPGGARTPNGADTTPLAKE